MNLPSGQLKCRFATQEGVWLVISQDPHLVCSLKVAPPMNGPLVKQILHLSLNSAFSFSVASVNDVSHDLQ